MNDTHRLLVGFALAFGLAAPALPGVAADGSLGVYSMKGSAHLRVSPLPEGDHPVELKATVERGRTPALVTVRLESQGHACVLDASRSGNGALEFSTPAGCPIDLRDPDARGLVTAQLRSGRGTLQGGRLTLDLRFEVDGQVATRVPRTSFTLFDAAITVPEHWTPPVPVKGTLGGRVSGVRNGP